MLITHARHGFGPAQVALCLTDLKLARLAHPKHASVEMAGYAACLREVTR